MIIKVLSVESERIGEKDYIKIIGRNEKGEKVIIYDKKYVDYFYIWTEDLEKLKEFVDSLKITTERRIIRPLKTEIVSGKVLGKERKLLKIYLNTSADANYIVEEVKKKFEKKTFERDIPLERHYLLDEMITPLTIWDLPLKKVGEKTYELEGKGEFVDYWRNPKIVAFDIEAYSVHGTPNPENDPIIMVSFYSEDEKFTITWKDAENIIKVPNERALIYKFFQKINEIDADILVGYNSDLFDFWYIRERCKKLSINIKDIRWVRRGRDWVPKMENPILIDLYTFIKNIISPKLKTEVLNLDAVAREILGEGKLLSKEERDSMGKIWDEGNVDLLVEYNLKDAELTYKLFMEFKDFLFELVYLINQDLYDISRMTYGQLVEWYLMKEFKKRGEIILNRPKDEEIRERQKITYTGAFVYEPKPGIYERIACIDFRSLYPTIMMTFNVSPDTLECEHDKCKENGIHAEIMGRKVYVWFCKKREGYVPQILKRIFTERVKLKKKLKTLEKGTEEYKLVNAKQHALKTIMNATYGYFGFPNSRYYNVKISAAVTAWGRELINKMIKFVKSKGYQVIYGDSITKERVVAVMENGFIKLRRIEELFEELSKRFGKVKIGEKEYIFPKGVKVLAWDGLRGKFVNLNYICRHVNKKKVYLVKTKYGMTRVTEDHSLIGKNGEIKPTDVKEDDDIIYVRELDNNWKVIKEIDLVKILDKNILEHLEWDENWIWLKNYKGIKIKRKLRGKSLRSFVRVLGFYVADGFVTMVKPTLSFSNSNVNLLKRLKKYIRNFVEGTDPKLIRNCGKERTIKYMTRSGFVELTYVDSSYKLQYGSKLLSLIFSSLAGKGWENKRVPDFIFNLPNLYKRLFLRYAVAGDGSKWFDDRYKENYKIKNFRYSTKSNLLASTLSFLLAQLGINFSIQYMKSKGEIRLNTVGKQNLRNCTLVEEVDYNGYVYDISTEVGNFIDCLGLIALHNTDSVYIGNISKEDALKLLEEINKMLPGYIEMDFEDYYLRGIWVEKKGEEKGAKKKYALIDEKGDLTIKGLEIVRRDWAKIAREVQEMTIRMILEGRKREEIIGKLKEVIEKIKNHEIPIEEFVIYEQITRDLSSYTAKNIPHVVAARRLQREGFKIRPGTVIGYVIIEGGGSISDRAFPIEIVKRENYRYDARYYIEHQIIPAIERILEAAGISVAEILGKGKQVGLTAFFKK